MEDYQRELLRVTNILCGKAFWLCRKEPSEENRLLASLAITRIKEVLRLFERHQDQSKKQRDYGTTTDYLDG